MILLSSFKRQKTSLSLTTKFFIRSVFNFTHVLNLKSESPLILQSEISKASKLLKLFEIAMIVASPMNFRFLRHRVFKLGQFSKIIFKEFSFRFLYYQKNYSDKDKSNFSK